MRNKALAFLLGGLILILPLVVSCAAPADGIKDPGPAVKTGWEVGDIAPPFNLVDADGKGVSLSDYAGKPILLNFFTTWCPSCKEEMPYLQQVYEKWTSKGLVMLAIDIQESPATVKNFMSANGLTLPVLFDLTGNTTSNYAVYYIPATFFIDGNGVIRYKPPVPFESVKMIEDELPKIMPR